MNRFSNDSFKNEDMNQKRRFIRQRNATVLHVAKRNVLLRHCLELLWLVKQSKQTIVCLKRKSLILTSCLVNCCRKSVSRLQTCLYYVYISTIIYYRPPPHVHKSVLHYEHAIIAVHRVSISFSLPISFIKQVWEVWVWFVMGMQDVPTILNKIDLTNR